MLSRSKSKERTSPRKVTPPSPAYMSNDHFASYLSDLRNNRVSRPGGARPQPSSSRPASSRRDSGPLSTGRPSIVTPPLSDASSLHQRTQSDVPNFSHPSRPSIGAASVSSRYSTVSGRGRDYYPSRPVDPLKPGEIVPSAVYMERGQRWMEKEEAVSLRTAMEDMDLGGRGEETEDEDSRIYTAALEEASELVWKHQHGVRLPTPGAPYRYKPHLRENSYAHARTASVGRYGDEIEPTGLARDGVRSVSGSSASSDGLGSMRSRTSMSADAETYGSGRGSLDQSARPSMDSARSPTSKSYGGISSSHPPVSLQNGRRRSSMKRNISGEVQKPFSGDQIYEEAEASQPRRSISPSSVDMAQPLRAKARNPLNRVQFAPDVPPSPESPPSNVSKMVSRYEIHRNPPSQSRNPQYTTNMPAERPGARDDVPRLNGVEIRSDDIRQATSMRLKDRSERLPTPSAVSDSPGRPIVSFDANWKAPEEATDEKPEEYGKSGRFEPPQAPNLPAITVVEAHHAAPPSPASRFQPPSIQIDSPPSGGPPIPTIVVPDGPGDDAPPSLPVVVTPDEGRSASRSSRPLPTPASGAPRVRPRGHWSPAPQPVGNRATATCHECGRPIEGRFVALAGSPERFHPRCFSCYACGTGLEALEISPEPDAHRAARLGRIGRRARGEVLEEEAGETMAEDGDARLRFYCHLDWHELFAPRCRHCRTPIMGDHVVALGAHWHADHFFCAECGDPFGPGETHIEKDGYAWCVSCQTKRTERRAPKCKMCGTAVIGSYVQALGGEWHDACFRCAACDGGFDDGQIFPREGRNGLMAVLCTRCREMELKSDS